MPAPTDEPPTPAPVRLLLCDDHAVVRAGLRALLSSAPASRSWPKQAAAKKPSPSPPSTTPTWSSWTSN